jgi:hypothetical protein
MTFPRLASSLRLLLLSLGAAGFVLAVAALALDVVLLAKPGRSAEPSPVAAAASGVLHWNDLEPENPTAFAAHLRALGCPEATIARLCESSPEDTQASVSAASEPARAEGMAAAPAEEDSLVTAAPVAATTSVPAPTAPAVQSIGAIPASGTTVANTGTTTSQSSGISSGTMHSGANARAHTRNVGMSAQPGAVAATGGGTVASAASAGSSDPVIVAPAGNDVKIPLVYQPADPNLTFNETQRSQWTRLQDQFANQVTASATPSATPQDGQPAASTSEASSTPDAKTWKTAQVSNDEMFRILYGEDAWLRQQVQANLHKSDAGATTP